MKKKAYSADRIWTKWFMPFRLYLPELYRRRYPHRKPTGLQLQRYQTIHQALSFVYLFSVMTAMGYGAYLFKNRSETDIIDTDDEKTKNLKRLATGLTVEDIHNRKSSIIYKFNMSTGLEKEDLTEEVKEYVLKRELKTTNKYDDVDYLARRAKMDKSDPRFDQDFWRAYFKRVDTRTPNDAIGEFLK